MKRAIVDGWDTNKAMEEATALGLANETLKQFFLAQIQQRKRRLRRQTPIGWRSGRIQSSPDGPVAQLGARLNGIQEVTGSIPVRSTTLRSRLPTLA